MLSVGNGAIAKHLLGNAESYSPSGFVHVMRFVAIN